ncbi:MAG: hypothetical protein HON90_05380 [Halobacteriovoraceae bacterium]|jgi:hypothetical protein|nr:hypothetical protein [Halobacteriovoraceae bacterium]
MKELQDLQENIITLLDNAYNLTRQALKQVQSRDFEKLVEVLDHRERAINVINSLSEKLHLYGKNPNTPISLIAFNNQVSQVIEAINNMDDIITTCLEHEKEKTQFEIAKTFKNKENFKGYNLNSLK